MSTQLSLSNNDVLERNWLARTMLTREFGLLWFGEGVSLLGTSTTRVLIPLLAITHFRAGPAWLGLLTAAAWLPWLALGLPAGAWVDRRQPRTVMIAADLAAAVALLSVPIGWWLGLLSLVQLLVISLIGGISAVFFQTAYVKLLPQLVSPALLGPANARVFGTESAAQITGPALGGLVAQLLAAAVGLLVDAASFLVSAICLWRIRPASPTEDAMLVSQGRLISQISEGIRLVARDVHLRALTLIGGASNFGLTGYQTLLVLFLVRQLELSPAAVGVVLMLGSIGGLLGALLANRIAEWLGTGRASTTLILISGPSALLIGLPWRPGQAYLVIAGLVLVGAAVVAGNVIRGAWRQRYVPAAVLGRVVSTSQVINYGTMPVAALAAGWLGDSLGVRTTILIMAGVHALACLCLPFTRLGRYRELPAAG
jgi:predicted MFS family arabinose efflux permease